jgi:hypothetical protein
VGQHLFVSFGLKNIRLALKYLPEANTLAYFASIEVTKQKTLTPTLFVKGKKLFFLCH